jgi:membrane carboxypeptidase/penicillin-binding protein PbpC
LGGGEVTLLDLTQVFASFANGGYRIEPNPFLVISDSKGKILREDQKEKVRVIDEGVAFIIADILADNIARAQAFGINNPLYLPGKRVAAKTGTTNDYKDAWTVGFSDKYVVGVWVGNNNNAIMHKIAGSLGAGPIFNKIMNFLIEERGGGSIATKLPENVIGIPCYSGRIEYFIKGTESKSYCQNTFLRPTSSTPSP